MDQNRQLVPIPTADGVELVGTYYRGRSGRDTPSVLMIHRYGSDRTKGDWGALAESLQREGFAVLTFDLRGHGGSTSVNPQFWTFPANVQNIRTFGSKKPLTITFNEFKSGYFPWLVNDVIAARRFLELKNDAGELNANSMFVLGAQEGAALGLMFVAEEFNRTYTIGFVPLQSNGTSHIAGDDIAGGIWLSLALRPNLATGLAPNMDVSRWFRSHPQIRDKVPMAFVYGDQDRQAKLDADTVWNLLNARGAARTERHKLDTRIDIKGTNLAGTALLGQPGLGVNGKVIEFVKKVMAERKAVPWSKIDPEINKITLANLGLLGFRF
jgi:pimeloyl-ACP methyl ester carboxylesterase